MRSERRLRGDGMSFTQQDWDSLMADYPPGTPVSGVVTSCQIFGVFVRLDQLPEVPALLEIIHLAIVEAAPNHGSSSRPTILRSVRG